MKSETEKTVVLPIWIFSGKNRFMLNLNQYNKWYYKFKNRIKIKFNEEVKDSLGFSFSGEIEIYYQYFAPDRRKRDLMNVIAVVDKFFQDAMSQHGCIEDDNTKIVKKVTCKYMGVDTENPRIEAIIKPYYAD
jgi:Holliday junction resolvase RusA-like endonuclease